MDAITFRQNDMLIKEIRRIRENETGQYKVKNSHWNTKTIQAITPPNNLRVEKSYQISIKK